jgi:hypothetical protein
MDVGEPLQADTATRDTAARSPDMGLKAGILFSNEGGETRLRFSRPSLLVLSRLSLEQKMGASPATRAHFPTKNGLRRFGVLTKAPIERLSLVTHLTQ